MHLSAVILGQHKNLAGVERVRTPCLTVEAEQDVPFQVDGDPGGSLPVEIQIRARASLDDGSCTAWLGASVKATSEEVN